MLACVPDPFFCPLSTRQVPRLAHVFPKQRLGMAFSGRKEDAVWRYKTTPMTEQDWKAFAPELAKKGYRFRALEGALIHRRCTFEESCGRRKEEQRLLQSQETVSPGFPAAW